MMWQKRLSYSFIILLFALLMLLFFYRLTSLRHLDDLNPNIPCSRELIEKSEYLSVIPFYNNSSIAEDKAWCQYILSFNKTLVLHGVYHTFKEFDKKRDYDYIELGIKNFESCFGYKPSEFKPPQLTILKENKLFLEEEFELKVHTWFSQRFHKVYHCNNRGIFPNWIADLI